MAISSCRCERYPRPTTCATTGAACSRAPSSRAVPASPSPSAPHPSSTAGALGRSPDRARAVCGDVWRPWRRWEVIGALEEGDDMLKLIEGLPYITGRSLEEPGSAPDVIFGMQKNFFGGLSKGIGDTRAEDRTGKLLRRVEIVRAGVL